MQSVVSSREANAKKEKLLRFVKMMRNKEALIDLGMKSAAIGITLNIKEKSLIQYNFTLLICSFIISLD